MRVFWLLLVVSLVALDLQSADYEGLECISELDIPQYSVFSRSAGLEGTAQVAVYLDSDGKPKKISVDGVHNILKREISEKLYGSAYRAACGSKVIRLRFVYKLEGKRTSGCFQSRVSLQPPNTFLIVTNPVEPTVD